MNIRNIWNKIKERYKQRQEKKKHWALIYRTVKHCKWLMKTQPHHSSKIIGVKYDCWEFDVVSDREPLVLLRSRQVRGDLIEIGSATGLVKTFGGMELDKIFFSYGDQSHAYSGMMGLCNDFSVPEHEVMNRINTLINIYMRNKHGC